MGHLTTKVFWVEVDSVYLMAKAARVLHPRKASVNRKIQNKVAFRRFECV